MVHCVKFLIQIRLIVKCWTTCKSANYPCDVQEKQSSWWLDDIFDRKRQKHRSGRQEVTEHNHQNWITRKNYITREQVVGVEQVAALPVLVLRVTLQHLHSFLQSIFVFFGFILNGCEFMLEDKILLQRSMAPVMWKILRTTLHSLAASWHGLSADESGTGELEGGEKLLDIVRLPVSVPPIWEADWKQAGMERAGVFKMWKKENVRVWGNEKKIHWTRVHTFVKMILNTWPNGLKKSIYSK